MSPGRLLPLLSLLVALSGPAFADACDALRPNVPVNMSREITGKLDVKLEGLAKLLNAGGNVEGTYRDTSNDVLKEYPNADALYMWERTFYLFCASLSASNLSDADKLDRIAVWMDRIPPPYRDDDRAVVPPCVKGASVKPAGNTFHLTFHAVEDGDKFRSFRLGREKGNSAQSVREAIIAGKIRTISDRAGLIIHIHGIVTDVVPRVIPYLIGEDRCERMVAAQRLADGEVRIVIPIRGSEPLGEISIILPRRIIESSRIAQVCVQATFPIAYATESRQNMICDRPGKGPYESVLQGRNRRTYFIARQTAAN